MAPSLVLIAGRGALHGRIAAALAEKPLCSIREIDLDALRPGAHDAIGSAIAVINCSDVETLVPEWLSDACIERGMPLVSCELTATGARIETLSPRSPDASCPSCLHAYRTRETETDPKSWRRNPDDLVTASDVVVLALHDAIEAIRLGAPADSRTHIIDFVDRTARAHLPIRHYACNRCSSFDPDAAQHSWVIGWASAHPPRSLIDLGIDLESLVVDSGEGVFQRLWTTGASEKRAVAAFCHDRGVHPDDTPFLDAEFASVQRRRAVAQSTPRADGQGFDFSNVRAAKSLALLEGLERLFALDWIDPRRLITASYASIAERALDPRELPLFSDEQHRDMTLSVRRFDPNHEMGWIRGVGLDHLDPVLVPADFVYGSAPDGIYLATSNGAACHSSLRHAVLNGIYETIERDALMVTWLNRMSLPRLAFSDADTDPYGLRSALGRLGFQLSHVDVTTDLDIPVALAILRDERDPDFFLCTMAAGLSRTRLLEKLYRDTAQFAHPHLVKNGPYRTAISSSDDPGRVRTLEDHLAFYQDRRKRPPTRFLDESAETRRWVSWPDSPDLTVDEELSTVRERLAAAGHAVIVVDCTAPLLHEFGLVVVKVVIPGLQPLHAGHQRAPLGGRRVFTVAKKMRRANEDATPGGLNPWPHPFW